MVGDVNVDISRIKLPSQYFQNVTIFRSRRKTECVNLFVCKIATPRHGKPMRQQNTLQVMADMRFAHAKTAPIFQPALRHQAAFCCCWKLLFLPVRQGERCASLIDLGSTCLWWKISFVVSNWSQVVGIQTWYLSLASVAALAWNYLHSGKIPQFN